MLTFRIGFAEDRALHPDALHFIYFCKEFPVTISSAETEEHIRTLQGMQVCSTLQRSLYTVQFVMES